MNCFNRNKVDAVDKTGVNGVKDNEKKKVDAVDKTGVNDVKDNEKNEKALNEEAVLAALEKAADELRMPQSSMLFGASLLASGAAFGLLGIFFGAFFGYVLHLVTGHLSKEKNYFDDNKNDLVKEVLGEFKGNNTELLEKTCLAVLKRRLAKTIQQ